MIRLTQYINTHKSYLLNVGATFFSQFSNALSLIILTPILTKNLGLSEFGIYGVILNVISFSVILDFGLNIGLIRVFIHRMPRITTLLNSIFLFFTILVIVLLPFYLLFYNNYFYEAKQATFAIAIFTSIIVVQNIFALYFDALIQSENKIYVSKIIRAFKLIIELLLILIFLRQITLLKILSLLAFVNLFYLLVLFYYLKIKINFKINLQDFDLKILLNHFKYSIWYFISSIATVLVFNTQIIILNYYSGAEIAAKYLVITRFFDIIRVASTNFTQVLFPKIILAEVNNQWEQIKKMLLQVFKRIFLLILFISFFFLTIGEDIFIYWIGFKDEQLLNLFNLYLFFTCLIILDNVSVVFLSALKLNKLPTIVSIFQGLIGIFLSIILLNIFGYTGLLIGFLCSFLLTNFIFNPYYLLRSINLKL